MVQREKTDSASGIRYDVERSISLVETDSDSERIEIVRATVSITRDAARAISITALEALRESARFMGVIGTRGELVNPFNHIDAALLV